MKKNCRLLSFTVLVLTVLVLGIFIITNQAQITKNQGIDKDDLIIVIKEYQHQAKFNQDALAELLKIAERANYNREALKTAAYILAKAGFHTVPVMEIAKIAGNADHEVTYLKDLLEITITYGGECENIVNLAKMAVDHKISEADLVARINFYRNNAQAKTIDEAVQIIDTQLAGVTKKIEQIIKEIQQQNNSQTQTDNPKNAQLIAEIKWYMSNATGNQSLAELLMLAGNARYNQSVIKTAAYFLSKKGSFNGWTVMSIARLAGSAEREIKQLNDLLEVSITYGGDSFRIVELAIKAVKNEISEAQLESQIAYYRNNAESKTIDEAIENNKKAIAGF